MSAASPCKRPGSPNWYVRRDVKGIGHVMLSTGTTNATRAKAYDALLLDLKGLGRLDVIRTLKAGRVTFAEVYANRAPAQLDALLARIEAPQVSALLEEWLTSGAQDRGIRERSMARYKSSWKHVSAILPKGATLAHLTNEFVTEFKRHRRVQAASLGAELSNATLNRDLAAIGAFLTWCAEEKGFAVTRPQLRYARESKGRTRWLAQEELARFREHCPAEWLPLFSLLFATGMTISEALGLRRADIDLRTRRVSIHEEFGRKLKRESRARDLSIPLPLVPLLGAWLEDVADRPDAKVFPFTYWPARKAWKRICDAADIHGAAIHDARHTFAVHAVQDGIPEARLQKLLGHAHAGTTRRYAAHSPEQYLERDAERIAERMGLAPTAPRLERLA